MNPLCVTESLNMQTSFFSMILTRGLAAAPMKTQQLTREQNMKGMQSPVYAFIPQDKAANAL